MDSFAFIIPFVFPGVFIRMIYNRFFPSIEDEKSKYNELVQSFIISTVILFINSIIIRIFYGVNIMSWDAFKEYIEGPNNFIIFFCIMLVLSLVGVFIYGWVIDYVAIKIINLIRKNKKIGTESKYPSPWHAVFENEELPLKDRPVGFFKDNSLITIGYVYYPTADKKTKEFKITSTDFIKELFLADPQKNNEDKLFHIVDAEYYDPQLNLLIKFYNNQKYLEYVKKYLIQNDIIS